MRGVVEHMYQSINSLYRRLKKMEQETEVEEKGRGRALVSINQLSVLQVEKDGAGDGGGGEGAVRGRVEHMYQSINSLYRRLKKMEQETEVEEKGRGRALVSINQLSVLQVEQDGARDGGGGEGAGRSTCINQSTLCSAG